MRNYKKIWILLFFLTCCYLIPNTKGIERIEETFYCPKNIHTPIIENLNIEKDEVITWDFTTFNSSFEAILGLWISTFTFVVALCVQETNGRGEYKITQTGDYRITAGNFGINDGYIHIVLENQNGISSYPLFIIFGIIGTTIIIKSIKVKRSN